MPNSQKTEKKKPNQTKPPRKSAPLLYNKEKRLREGMMDELGKHSQRLPVVLLSPRVWARREFPALVWM
jgi:hypothetical protein